jgi:D-arabinose 1-dehydrogenase
MDHPLDRPHLAQTLPTIALGGAGFSYQTQKNPTAIPVVQVIKRAFDHGIRVIDTSP